MENYPFSENSINSSIAFRSLLNATSYPGRSFQINKIKKPSVLSSAEKVFERLIKSL